MQLNVRGERNFFCILCTFESSNLFHSFVNYVFNIRSDILYEINVRSQTGKVFCKGKLSSFRICTRIMRFVSFVTRILKNRPFLCDFIHTYRHIHVYFVHRNRFSLFPSRNGVRRRNNYLIVNHFSSHTCIMWTHGVSNLLSIGHTLCTVC